MPNHNPNLKAAVMQNNVAEVYALLKQPDIKESINQQDDQGKTLLHYACETDSWQAAEILIIHDADIGIKDFDKKLCFEYLSTIDVKAQRLNAIMQFIYKIAGVASAYQLDWNTAIEQEGIEELRNKFLYAEEFFLQKLIFKDFQALKKAIGEIFSDIDLTSPLAHYLFNRLNHLLTVYANQPELKLKYPFNGEVHLCILQNCLLYLQNQHRQAIAGLYAYRSSLSDDIRKKISITLKMFSYGGKTIDISAEQDEFSQLTDEEHFVVINLLLTKGAILQGLFPEAEKLNQTCLRALENMQDPPSALKPMILLNFIEIYYFSKQTHLVQSFIDKIIPTDANIDSRDIMLETMLWDGWLKYENNNFAEAKQAFDRVLTETTDKSPAIFITAAKLGSMLCEHPSEQPIALKDTIQSLFEEIRSNLKLITRFGHNMLNLLEEPQQFCQEIYPITLLIFCESLPYFAKKRLNFEDVALNILPNYLQDLLIKSALDNKITLTDKDNFLCHYNKAKFQSSLFKHSKNQTNETKHTITADAVIRCSI